MPHNGGITQLGFNFLQTGNAYPFINHLKTAQTWIYWTGGGAPAASELDANGYPHTISNSGVYTIFYVPIGTNRPGNWIIKWVGEGSLTLTLLTGSYTLVSGSLSGVDGRAVVTLNATPDATQVASIRVQLAIRTRGVSDYIRSLAFIHEDDETLYDAGEVFNPDFIARLVEANPGVLRFLDWQDGNTTNVVRWEHRKPVDYVFYAGHEIRESLYAGTTTNVGNDYSVSLPGFVLADKAVVHVRFNASATADTITLNVNGTGAIPVTHRTTDATFSSARWPVANVVGTLVYEADLGKWLLSGGSTEDGVYGLKNTVPPEVMVDLCEKIGAHPWFVMPPMACDPLSDHITGLATYIRDNGPSWMVPRFEGPNELWNTAAGFYATRYARTKALARWGVSSFDEHNWYGMVMSDMGQAISAVYGDDRTRYQVVCGVQTYAGTTSASDPRLNSTRYVAEGGSAAKNWGTHVAIANYFLNGYMVSSAAAEIAAATDYAAADDEGKAEIVTAYVEDAYQSTAGGFGVPQFEERISLWKTWADGFNVGLKLTCYEGGWTPDYVFTANRNALRKASKSHEVIAHLTGLIYQKFIEAGGEYPSCFNFSGVSAWSVLDPDLYTETPAWTAIKLSNAGKRRLRLK